MDGNHQHADATSSMMDVDMGYEDCAPQPRRGSMSLQEERVRRASIQNIMADPKMSPMAKRRSIQHLMDGRRNSLTAACNTTTNNNNNNNHCIPQLPLLDDLNNGDGNNYGYGLQNEQNYNNKNNGYHYSSSEQQEAAEMYGYGDTEMSTSDRGGSATTTRQQHQSGSMLGALCNEQTRNAVLNAPHCPHYDRKCTIISPCCGAAFGCRFCHDDCPAL